MPQNRINFQDNRKKQIIFLSSCMLNQNNRYPEIATTDGSIVSLIAPLLKEGIGIEQLPCLECMGWGGVSRKTIFKFIPMIYKHHKSKLIKALTEGFASYGYIVINIKVKIKQGSSAKKLKGLIFEEFQSFIKLVFDFFNQKRLIHNPEYSIIDISRAQIPIQAYLSEQMNRKIIKVNPKIRKKNFREIWNFESDFQNVFYIFSRRSLIFLKNKSLTKLSKNNLKVRPGGIEIAVLDKSNRNFKYYETVLLGLIIDDIDNN